jgi:replication factor C small subunit
MLMKKKSLYFSEFREVSLIKICKIIRIMQELWTEKYRPRVLEDIIGQPNIVRRLRSLINRKNLPHCLFAGPAGVGKTSAALAIASELFGESWKSNFLDMNASDERGIDVIRLKIKDFARTLPVVGNFKIVYLDEADSLTRDAQHALRRIMEDFSDSCRFILSCNWSSKIIPPIQSRCAIFRFAPLSTEDGVRALVRIAQAEGIKADQNTLTELWRVCGGDLRRAINTLQSVAIEGEITTQRFAELIGREPNRVKAMLDAALSGNFSLAQNILAELFSAMSAEDIVSELHSASVGLEIAVDKKVELLQRIGECEFRITEGSNPRIQLEALLAWIAAKMPG